LNNNNITIINNHIKINSFLNDRIVYNILHTYIFIYMARHYVSASKAKCCYNLKGIRKKNKRIYEHKQNVEGKECKIKIGREMNAETIRCFKLLSLLQQKLI
jgi:hypothetical protein